MKKGSGQTRKERLPPRQPRLVAPCQVPSRSACRPSSEDRGQPLQRCRQKKASDSKFVSELRAVRRSCDRCHRSPRDPVLETTTARGLRQGEKQPTKDVEVLRQDSLVCLQLTVLLGFREGPV